jgi:hypothetical protein
MGRREDLLKVPNLVLVALGKRSSMLSAFWSETKRLEKIDSMQPGEAKVGGEPGRLALVELEVLH